MIDTKSLIKGNEYYFFFQSYLCAGFVLDIEENLLRVRNGAFLYTDKELYFKEALLDINFIIGVADT